MNEQFEFQVSGMSCSGCEERIGTALRRLDGVTRSSADHESGQVRVAGDPAQMSATAIRARIEEMGYGVADDGRDRR